MARARRGGASCGHQEYFVTLPVRPARGTGTALRSSVAFVKAASLETIVRLWGDLNIVLSGQGILPQVGLFRMPPLIRCGKEPAQQALVTA